MTNQDEEQLQSPPNPKRPSNAGNKDTLFTPRFRSAAAMAGWDEEALLQATLVVEDTPEREPKYKRRVHLQFKTPPTNSRRKRRNQRASTPVVSSVVLNLDDEEKSAEEEKGKRKEGLKAEASGKSKKGEGRKDDSSPKKPSVDSSSGSVLPCMDRLREELSCAICLEICFEPSTTPCGHSFCKKCLKSAADKCGKRCPKCRQIIGNGRSCIVNTILWNTIQLLFPKEVEARKAANQCPQKNDDKAINQSTRISRLPNGADTVRRRRGMPSQDEDAALALRLQREEFMGVHRGTHDNSRTTQVSSATANHEESRTTRISSTRANLRAMAARAMNLRIRGRPM